jgi:hypothetical protein
METVTTENQFLTQEELQTLKSIQNNTQSLISELGEIEMIKIQIENRYNNAKEFLQNLTNQEIEFTKSMSDKYGKVSVNPKTGEITKMD